MPGPLLCRPSYMYARPAAKHLALVLVICSFIYLLAALAGPVWLCGSRHAKAQGRAGEPLGPNWLAHCAAWRASGCPDGQLGHPVRLTSARDAFAYLGAGRGLASGSDPVRWHCAGMILASATSGRPTGAAPSRRAELRPNLDAHLASQPAGWLAGWPGPSAGPCNSSQRKRARARESESESERGDGLFECKLSPLNLIERVCLFVTARLAN